MELLVNQSFKLLEKSLDSSTLKQNVITNNISNVDTPFFKRSDVQFESLLQNELNKNTSFEGVRTNVKHFRIGNDHATIEPKVIRDENSIFNNNNNNVDIEYEMALLAENQLRYNLLIQQINHEIKQTRTAIGGRP
ncbi:flagellar basal body rod protein FlgB [Chengkuizengella axinellae]|uniref:Flagellar basal body rod protein FlgB n=1 Tax=Chengkuizengella axinellae TaxID=3064388 RepID=A0ABT9IXA2_9BACL|nr:flagellar basal body rod protein FlgB [Chengkuizengella sp. 2205SS18-9]MDP5273434.1 flagellar basal body rod protein FlgB [Chengkuizengella sp. 2205SS18-9]